MWPALALSGVVGFVSTAALSALPAGFQETPAAIPSTGTVLKGVWLFPDATTPVPGVVIVGGTLSHTRDGAMLGAGPAGAQRDALRRLALRLAAAGYASLRWDKRGCGDTPPGPQPVTNELEADDVAAAIKLARDSPRITQVIVAGESAGGYFACMAAGHGAEADGYIFLGCLASSSKELFRYNFGRFKEWALQSDANRRWAEKHALGALALGYGYEGMFEAAQRGQRHYVIEYRGKQFRRSLVRIRTEMNKPPGDLFKDIVKPTLIVQGAADMNVPPGDAAVIEKTIKAAGNDDVTKVSVPGVDHSFQYVSETMDDRIKDRHSFASFYRLYSPKLYAEIRQWLGARFPTKAKPVLLAPPPRPGIIAWDGIQVIEDVTDPQASPGVETLEGRIGPLLKGDDSQAHYIEMPPGLFVHEHSHSTESIIYTVAGRWVLCSGGRRRLMKPATLFWFKKGTPTGYEVPFEQPAFILIFKGARSDLSDEQFWQYLQGLAEKCKGQNQQGEAFRLVDLAPDHPARVFARTINPQWERKLPRSPRSE